MLRITDKAFRYVPSHSTDLAKRFKEIIEQQRQLAAGTGRGKGRVSPKLAIARPARIAA